MAQLVQSAAIARAQTPTLPLSDRSPRQPNPRTVTAAAIASGSWDPSIRVHVGSPLKSPGAGGVGVRCGTAPAASPATGLGGSSPLTQFRMTRGLVYSVFEELDQLDTGKLTYSTFEDAAVVIGMSGKVARQLFDS